MAGGATSAAGAACGGGERRGRAGGVGGSDVVDPDVRAGCHGSAGSATVTRGWTAERAAEWIQAIVNPLTWVQLVEELGWSQREYEQRLVTITRQVLVRAKRVRQ